MVVAAAGPFIYLRKPQASIPLKGRQSHRGGATTSIFLRSLPRSTSLLTPTCMLPGEKQKKKKVRRWRETIQGWSPPGVI